VTDVAATALALAAVPARELPGVSLLAGPVPTEPALVLGGLLFGEEWAGLRTPRLKYMRSDSGEERLFDLGHDPGERVNVVGAMPAALATMRARLGFGAP
jgi:hypothetical protein